MTRPLEHFCGGLAFGLAMWGAFPPVGLWPLTFVGVAVLVWTACRAGDRPARAGLLAGLGTLPFWLAEQAWLMNVTPVGYPLLAVYLSVYSGLAVYMLACVRRSGRRLPMSLAAPLVWLALEVPRGEFVLTGYAWFLAGHPVIDQGFLALPARLFGAYSISFLVAAAAGTLADAAGWSGVPRRWGGIGAVIVAALWIGASLFARAGLVGSEAASAGAILRVGVVQTDIAQGRKLSWTIREQAEDFQRFLELTRAAALNTSAGPPDLLLWPETMFPGYALNPEALTAAGAYADSSRAEPNSPMHLLTTGFAQALCTAQADLGVPMLVGAEARDGVHPTKDANGKPSLAAKDSYNSALVIAGGRPLGRAEGGRYDKIELTPFGEAIPWVGRFPAVERFLLDLGAGGMEFNLSVGDHADPVGVPLSPESPPHLPRTLRIATPICFEATRSSLCRRLAYTPTGELRADLLVNLSNDGWFGEQRWWFVPGDAGRRQHLLAARWRCVELGLPMVRAVNTGVSAFIDHRGRLLSATIIAGSPEPTRSEAAIVGEILLTPRPTLYGRIGNAFAWLAAAAGLGLWGFAARRGPSRR